MKTGLFILEGTAATHPTAVSSTPVLDAKELQEGKQETEWETEQLSFFSH